MRHPVQLVFTTHYDGWRRAHLVLLGIATAGFSHFVFELASLGLCYVFQVRGNRVDRGVFSVLHIYHCKGQCKMQDTASV